MGRIQVLAGIWVIWIAAALIHLVSAAIFGPTSPLYDMAVSASMGGQDWTTNMYEVLAVWVPWIAVMGSAAFGFIYEYRYQRATALTPQ